jgi:hypothetical protein
MKNWYEIQDKKYTEKVWILAFFNTKHECHGFAEGDKDPIFYYENSLSPVLMPYIHYTTSFTFLSGLHQNLFFLN